MSIYDYSILDRSGKEIGLKEYKGKVLIIVNTQQDVVLLLNMKD